MMVSTAKLEAMTQPVRGTRNDRLPQVCPWALGAMQSGLGSFDKFSDCLARAGPGPAMKRKGSHVGSLEFATSVGCRHAHIRHRSIGRLRTLHRAVVPSLLRAVCYEGTPKASRPEPQACRATVRRPLGGRPHHVTQ